MGARQLRRRASSPLTWGPFTGEFRVDTVYHYSFANPKDNTISGSSEVFRHNEFQVTQLGIGGDFLYKNVQARLMTQFGMYSETTPRNDASPARGQWNLDDAYRYISEAYGGYHFDVMNGINIQAGIFMSYVGLWSYYNFDNWTYQPSYVSSNTPWFFNGMRVQIFPTDKLKIEPWLVNGWQSYGKFNEAPGVGLQILWRPTGWLSILGNQYFGTDTLGNPDRKRIHTDDSIMVQVLRQPGRALQQGRRVAHGRRGLRVRRRRQLRRRRLRRPRSTSSASWRTTALWFADDQLGLTVGGGAITNPGRYLVLAAADQRRDGVLGHALLHGEPGRPVQGVGHAGDRRLHAAAVRHVPARVQPPRRQRAVLLRPGRRHAAGRQQRQPRRDDPQLGARSRQLRESDHDRDAPQVLMLPDKLIAFAALSACAAGCAAFASPAELRMDRARAIPAVQCDGTAARDRAARVLGTPGSSTSSP